MHPADAADLAAIGTATGFMASLFLGRGRWAKSPISPSLGGAKHWGVLLVQRSRAIRDLPRKPAIYALLPDGRSILVPDGYQPLTNGKETAMSVKTYSKRSNAQRAAKSALGDGIEGVDFVTYETKPGAWAWAEGSKAPKADKAPKAPRGDAAGDSAKKERQLGKRAAAEAAAREGKLPTPPDFSAKTHERYRPKLEEVVKMAKAGDIKGLKGYAINPTSTSPKAIARYRDLAVIALEARTGR